MEDEARHVAFGRVALRDVYPQLTEAQRAGREEFCAEACWLMRDRFLADEVWERLGLPVEECVRWVEGSESQRLFRSMLFTRIVPTLRDIGLFGPAVQRAFAEMGVLGYADLDLDAVSAADEKAAGEIDDARRRQVGETIEAGSPE
jgi:hypothetical protein